MTCQLAQGQREKEVHNPRTQLQTEGKGAQAQESHFRTQLSKKHLPTE